MYLVYYTGIHTNSVRCITDRVTVTYNTCNPFRLFQVNIVPGYPLRASSNSWIILSVLFSQIAYPNETHYNKNTDKCSSLIFSHRQNLGRVLMTHWRRSPARQRKCSASSTSLTFNIIYYICYHIQLTRTHLQIIYLEVNRTYFLLVICCGVLYVFCFIYMTYFDCT